MFYDVTKNAREYILVDAHHRHLDSVAEEVIVVWIVTAHQPWQGLDDLSRAGKLWGCAVDAVRSGLS